MRFIKTAWPLALLLGLGACVTESGGQAPPSATAPAAQPQQAEPAQAKAASPDRLIGMTDKEIAKIFGKPSLKRREAGAEFWQFSGPNCVMDLYFYAEAEAKRVSYVTLRDPQTGRVGTDACQERLARLPAN